MCMQAAEKVSNQGSWQCRLFVDAFFSSDASDWTFTKGPLQVPLQTHSIGQLNSTGQLHSTDAFFKVNLDKSGMLLVSPMEEQIVFRQNLDYRKCGINYRFIYNFRTVNNFLVTRIYYLKGLWFAELSKLLSSERSNIEIALFQICDIIKTNSFKFGKVLLPDENHNWIWCIDNHSIWNWRAIWRRQSNVTLPN